MIASSDRSKMKRLALGWGEPQNRSVEMNVIPRVGDCIAIPTRLGHLPNGGSFEVVSVTWGPFNDENENWDVIVVMED